MPSRNASGSGGVTPFVVAVGVGAVASPRKAASSVSMSFIGQCSSPASLDTHRPQMPRTGDNVVVMNLPMVLRRSTAAQREHLGGPQLSNSFGGAVALFATASPNSEESVTLGISCGASFIRWLL